jgi:hypothetical protein
MSTGYEKTDTCLNYGLLNQNINYITDKNYKSENKCITPVENNLTISEIICPCKIKLNLFGRK